MFGLESIVYALDVKKRREKVEAERQETLRTQSEEPLKPEISETAEANQQTSEVQIEREKDPTTP